MLSWLVLTTRRFLSLFLGHGAKYSCLAFCPLMPDHAMHLLPQRGHRFWKVLAMFFRSVSAGEKIVRVGRGLKSIRFYMYNYMRMR